VKQPKHVLLSLTERLTIPQHENNKPVFNAGKFKYLRTTSVNQNCMHEGITSIFILGNICFYFAHCYLKPCRLQYIDTKTLSVVCMGVKVRSLTLKDEHGQGAFVNTVLAKICRPTRQEVT